MFQANRNGLPHPIPNRSCTFFQGTFGKDCTFFQGTFGKDCTFFHGVYMQNGTQMQHTIMGYITLFRIDSIGRSGSVFLKSSFFKIPIFIFPIFIF